MKLDAFKERHKDRQKDSQKDSHAELPGQLIPLKVHSDVKLDNHSIDIDIKDQIIFPKPCRIEVGKEGMIIAFVRFRWTA